MSNTDRPIARGFRPFRSDRCGALTEQPRPVVAQANTSYRTPKKNRVGRHGEYKYCSIKCVYVTSRVTITSRK